MLFIMISDQYPNYYKALEIFTGYFDSLDIMILFSYPSCIIITRDYCIWSQSVALVHTFFLSLLGRGLLLLLDRGLCINR